MCTAILPIRNMNRVVGTILGSEVTRRYGADGLPHDTIRFHFKGRPVKASALSCRKELRSRSKAMPTTTSAKGLSGGKIAVYPIAESEL